MTLRDATPHDVEAMAAVWRAAALQAYADIFPPEAPTPVLADMVAVVGTDLADPCTRGFVLDDGGTIIGLVMIGVWPGTDDVGRLSRLYVDPQHWGRGLGTRLHDAAVAALRPMRYPTARLWTLRDNVHARALYEHWGWKLTDEINVVYDEGGVVDVQYELVL